MKSLILLEGNNDYIFINEIIRNSPSHNIKCNHFRNAGNKGQKKTEETTLLRKFVEKNNSYNLLIKEELGKKVLLNLFNDVIINFLATNKNIYLTMVFDHDSTDSQKEIRKLQEDLKSKTSSKLEFISRNQNRQILTGLNYMEFTLIQNSGKHNNNLNNFSIISFNKSLEFEAARCCNKLVGEICMNDIRNYASKIKFDQLFPHHY